MAGGEEDETNLPLLIPNQNAVDQLGRLDLGGEGVRLIWVVGVGEVGGEVIVDIGMTA